MVQQSVQQIGGVLWRVRLYYGIVFVTSLPPYKVYFQLVTKFRESKLLIINEKQRKVIFATFLCFGTLSGVRTLDPLIKSQLLYQLS